VNDADTVSETVTISHTLAGGGYNAVTMTNFTVTMNDAGIYFVGNYYLTVTSPDTGRVWLDRNLGATQVATSRTDSAAYGDLYQWGRATNGHEKRNSAVTELCCGSSSTLETSITGTSNNFISDTRWNDNDSGVNDWVSLTVDDNGDLRSAAWADGGANDICPAGFSVPTNAEIIADTSEATTTTVTGGTTAFSSFLKIPSAGYRNMAGGNMASVGDNAHWWSSTPYFYSGGGRRALPTRHNAYDFYVGGSNVLHNGDYRTYGKSVRCIKSL
jgi:uncharacterized protein (TIGR02145 family)